MNTEREKETKNELTPFDDELKAFEWILMPTIVLFAHSPNTLPCIHVPKQKKLPEKITREENKLKLFVVSFFLRQSILRKPLFNILWI